MTVFWSVYEHKETHLRLKYLSRELTKADRSLIRLKRRLYNACKIIKFRSFITLTYNNENLEVENSDDIRKFINRLRMRLKKKCLIQSKFSFLWKFETDSRGQREYNPHFHLMTSLKYTKIKLKKLIESVWKHGFIHHREIKNAKQASKYCSKYFSKENNMKTFDDNRRRWSCSRDIPATPKSEYKFIGDFRTNELQKEVIDHNEKLEPLKPFLNLR